MVIDDQFETEVTADMDEQQSGPTSALGGHATRWLPLVVIVAAAGLAFAMGWHRYLSFKTIGVNYQTLRTFIDANLILAILAYTGIYVAVVALSLPGALVMTLAGGLLFGWKIAAPATVVAATIGGSILFLVARSSFGETLAHRAGAAVAKLRDGFQENALSYMLFLRLVPLFPFFVVN
ncbi:MAG: TVP38/TMEM64 family protein, partial [Proteobacteria bacterium]|nr:TVP38/TMEM64 family protein [Pseudomonadota bacterium]